ncbi:MAG: hypothetical protein V9E86_02840 [Nitrosomonas sp.]
MLVVCLKAYQGRHQIHRAVYGQGIPASILMQQIDWPVFHVGV